MAKRGASIFVVVDGREGKAYEGYASNCPPRFSPVGHRLACAMITRDRAYVVVDGKETGPYRNVADLRFSPDGKHFAFVGVIDERNQTVVVDGVEGNSYGTIFMIRENKQLIHFDSASSFHYIALRGRNIYLVEEKLK